VPPGKKIIALNHMTRFQCLGGSCEDTCCQTWGVTIDQGHYHKLSKLMKHERFDDIFVKKPVAERTRDGFATIRMGADDRCPLLSTDLLCTLHARHGEPSLPDICSSYPRFVNEIGGRKELSGSMSCPEVVRQALLVEDGVDLVEADAALLGRAPVVQRPLAGDAQLVDEIRGTMVALLGFEQYPLQSRLFFLTSLAQSAEPHVAPGQADYRALSALTDHILTPSVLDDLHARYRANIAPSPHADQTLLGQLGGVFAVARPALGSEIERIVDTYVATGALSKSDEGISVTDTFHATWAARRAMLSPSLEPTLDRATHHFAVTYCMRQLYLRKASLSLHVIELLLRLATWRFLLLSDAPTTEPEFSARLVQLVYQLARVVDHSPETQAALLAPVPASLPTLGAVAGLLLY